ncbi:MAG: VTT domain-containing protein [Porphyrobacter sp.]|nr:VTT domain-containing protein [Porphyrobacter sp.]
MDVITPIIGQLGMLGPLLQSEVLLGLLFLVLTATLVGSGVPGVLVPISFSSGALLGGWLGMLVVVLGAVLGSHGLFLLARRSLSDRLRRRWGPRLERFDRDISQRGFFYLLGLRLLGMPHMLVTAACALSPLKARSFALATLLGFLPAVTLAAMAGSAV